jgi:DNA-binding CsgD family transcriptional regulator
VADSLVAARPVGPRAWRGNLPARASSFVGREIELAEVRGLLAGSRLVTLTGMGGAGKTRLGLRVAAELAASSGDEGWFADLAPVIHPDLVPVTVADVLGIRPEPARPVLETLVETVGRRSLLVLLDNCEHVLMACAKLADELLRGCPELTVLATSREPLGVDGEQVYRVPPMGIPADGDPVAAIRTSEAVRLFEDRAAAHGVALAWDCCAEALAIAGAADDSQLVCESLYVRAWILLRQGRRDAARPIIESALAMARSLAAPYLTGCLLATRAHASYAAGDQAAAASDAARALPLFRQAGDRQHVATMLGNLGNYEMSAGNTDVARRYLAEALDIFRGLSHRNGIAYQTFNLGLAEYLSGAPGPARALFAESLELTRRMGMKALVPYALIGLAMADQDQADPGRPARLHGAADQALADVGRALEPLESRLAGLHRQRLRASMGAEAFEAEYATGRALDLAEALAALDRMQDAAEPDAAHPGPAVTVLTSCELDVLKLVAQGLSNSEIARRLVLSDHTVHRHLANIRRKLDLSSRAAAAAWGVRAGLV